MYTRAPRGSGFRKEHVSASEMKRKRKRERAQAERIVESNIRRTFTVRFPNLYCVWQRCRDIRGSYRNVLLLIVLHPEGSGGRERRVAARRTETENRKRGTFREDERRKRFIRGIKSVKGRKRQEGSARGRFKGDRERQARPKESAGENARKTEKWRKGKRTIREHSVHWCF